MGGTSVIIDAIRGLNSTVLDVERLLALAEMMPNQQEVFVPWMLLSLSLSLSLPLSLSALVFVIFHRGRVSHLSIYRLPSCVPIEVSSKILRLQTSSC
jgi:hypothetical protein